MEVYQDTDDNNEGGHFEQIKPSLFAGPACWHILKASASKYEPTERNRRLYKQWIELTLQLFPCDICSQHSMLNWKKHDINNYLESKDRLYLYISMVLQDGANEARGIPIDQRPGYYDNKRFIFESMNGDCKGCGH